MRGMRIRSLLIVLGAATLAACVMQGGGSPGRAQRPSGESPSGAAQPGAPNPAQPPPAPPEPPSAPPPREFRLGAATTALVAQAHGQAGGGDYGQAAVTLERALRIEPDNPLLWIELGRVRLGESNAAQADATGRKALALATGDPAAQAGAWRLIADSLRARNRNQDASEADRRAESLAPR